MYQVYPRSFCDSSGDGIGDIPGIISKLDYLRDLGFQTVWFSPFFRSPQRDFGYDVSDFRDIAPEYGSLADVERLIREMHRRDMKILLDLVLNHTSDEHPWFLESRSSRNNPRRDWYVWRDGRGPAGRRPPNNWRSKVAGSGWHYDLATGQWYWASFLAFQPDLNYRNPEVRQTMLDTLRFWLERGVDGFRLDILGSLFEDAEFRDNPPTWRFFPSVAEPDRFFRSTGMTENHPDTLEFTRCLRALMDRYGDPPRFLVGEVFGGFPVLRRYCGGERPEGLHSVFLFRGMDTPLEARPLRRLIEEAERHFPEPFTPTWVFSNHDRMRRITVLGNNRKKARLNALLQFTLRGIPCAYYGEEIGMQQGTPDFERARDPLVSMVRGLSPFAQRLVYRYTRGVVDRDCCRLPMQWSSGASSGFCPAGTEPWLSVHENHATVNVERQTDQPDSLLSFYRRLLHLRKAHPELQGGHLELIPASRLPRGVLAYRRCLPAAGSAQAGTAEGPGLRVYLNLGRRRTVIPLGAGGQRLFLSTRQALIGESASVLRGSCPVEPLEGIVIGP